MTPERPQEIAEKIRDERGPDRVMEVQRARMWERDPLEWTRYERVLSEAYLELEGRLAEATEALRAYGELLRAQGLADAPSFRGVYERGEDALGVALRAEPE